eukprot:m.232093 g.232093  ORF g.232093 m.232093 type:complete len:413 (-) comp18880_c1_seq4:269-1507(-)
MGQPRRLPRRSGGSALCMKRPARPRHMNYLRNREHQPVIAHFRACLFSGDALQETYSYGINSPPTHDCPGKPAKCYTDMWHNLEPGTDVVPEIFYSTNFYTTQAISIIKDHPQDKPLFLYLPYQGVHSPYTEPPPWEHVDAPKFWDSTFADMLAAVDNGIKNVTNALHEKGLWDDTLMIVSSDNGGIMPGNNYPLRGEKATHWEGGSRVMAFVTGGYLPTSLVGQTTDTFVHVSDWYATLCNIMNVDPTDTVVLEGKPRPIDSLDMWSHLTTNASSPREYLPITPESIIWKSQYKLITQADPTFWYTKNDTHIPDDRTAWPCRKSTDSNGCHVCSDKDPCLFDIIQDPSERTDISKSNPSIVAQLQAKLAEFQPYVSGKMNATALAKYDCVTDISQWWGNFTGPCCKRKKDN